MTFLVDLSRLLTHVFQCVRIHHCKLINTTSCRHIQKTFTAKKIFSSIWKAYLDTITAGNDFGIIHEFHQ